MSNDRYIIAKIKVDDDEMLRCMETNGIEDTGDIDFFEKEFHWLDRSGFSLESARIVDDDDPEDAECRDAVQTLFE